MNLLVSRALVSSGFGLFTVLLTGVAAAGSPDILGVTMGMPVADAYNAVKAADATHRVGVSQITIPELLGDKPAVYRLAPDTRDPSNTFYVNTTLPPNPQVVWQVYHQLAQLHVTQEQALASLTNKYGAKYRSRLPFTPTSSVGTFRWIYDEQGNLSDMPFSQEAKCLQTNGVMDPLGVLGNYQPGVIRSAQPDVQLRQIPPIYDPATLPQCQHLVWVEATIQGNGLVWTITITITDWDIEHRYAIALDNYFNGLATKRQNQEINQAEHTAVPKL
jgi:hypothetical protein